jgi:hypothetical protein
MYCRYHSTYTLHITSESHEFGPTLSFNYFGTVARFDPFTPVYLPISSVTPLFSPQIL